MNPLDDLDRRIIAELQENFPLETDPYRIMAENLDISVDLLWQRIQTLAESGIIRRIGFSIDSRKIGYSSTLVAVRVPDNLVERACELIERYPQITHSYLRDDDFNIWFTVIAQSTEDIATILKQISEQLHLKENDVMDLPAEKLFKLDARFK